MMHNKKNSLLFSESGNTKFIFMMHHKKDHPISIGIQVKSVYITYVVSFFKTCISLSQVNIVLQEFFS